MVRRSGQEREKCRTQGCGSAFKVLGQFLHAQHSLYTMSWCWGREGEDDMQPSPCLRFCGRLGTCACQVSHEHYKPHGLAPLFPNCRKERGGVCVFVGELKPPLVSMHREALEFQLAPNRRPLGGLLLPLLQSG